MVEETFTNSAKTLPTQFGMDVPKKMLAAIFYGGENIRLEEIPIPVLKDDEVLLKVELSGICGSDINFFGKKQPANIGRTIRGHEIVGYVVACGSKANNLRLGSRVVVDPMISCGVCHYCRSNNPHLCSNLKVIGGAGWMRGGFAEYVAIPHFNAYPIPDSLQKEAAVFAEPLACCLHTLQEARIQNGSIVAILGAGSMGVLMTQSARLSGASQLFITDLIPQRLERAIRLGADIGICAIDEDVEKAILTATDRYGIDIVIDTIGSSSTISQGINILRTGGTLAVLGTPPPDQILELDLVAVQRRGLKISFPLRFRNTFDIAVRLLHSKRISTEGLITHHFPLSKIVDAFKTAIESPARIKIVLDLLL